MQKLYQSDIISINDLSLETVEKIFSTAKHFKEKKLENAQHQIKDKIIAHCFFEPSTRTRLSFETATLKLAGKVIGFDSINNLSIQKGETLHDTIRIIDNYADLIIIRHQKEGAARLAADVAQCPVINAGDGGNQHPTQALTDFFTILECQGKLQELSIALVGDLKHGRSIHSFLQLSRFFDMRLFLISPETLTLPQTIADELKMAGVRFSFHEGIEDVISKVDILYLNRIQKERLSMPYYQVGDAWFTLTKNMLRDAKPTLKVLDPLPRVGTMEKEIDETPFAHYFQQAANAVYIRQALLSLLLNDY